MLLAGLLLLTGVATGLQILRQFLWIVWGAPLSWLCLIGLVGSGLICFGGCRAIANGTGLRATVVGLLLAWVFYSPSLYETISVIREDGISGREQQKALVTTFVPPVLLLAASVVVLVTFLSNWGVNGRRAA